MENGRELSWLVERWTTALAAALTECGVGVSGQEWRPVADRSLVEACGEKASWWRAGAFAIGLGSAARSAVGATVLPSRVLERAAEICAGGAGEALEPLAAAPSGSLWAARFQLESGGDLQIAVASVGREEKPAQPAPAAPPIRERMGMLLKVEVPITISLGKADMPLKDALKLTRGSVVELDRTFNDPVEVVVNGRLVARGDIVVVEDKYAVRIREIYREESGPIWPGMEAASA